MDAGAALIDHLFAEMQIDPQWSIRHPRGFTWWAGTLAQHVWAEPAVQDMGIEIARVHVQTDLLRNFTPHANSLLRLGITTGFATLSGLLVGEGIVRSAASIFVHNETLPMWKRLLSIASLLQVSEAHIMVEMLASLTNSLPAISSHPTSGLRNNYDDMLNVIRDVYSPMGRGRSWFIGTGFRDAEQRASPAVSLLTNADEHGLTAEFPFGDQTALFRMMTDVQHPRLGSGLMLVLALPISYSNQPVPEIALQMNQRELSEFTRNPFLGSWCPHPSIPNTLSFVSFFPNVCSLPGLPATLLHYWAGKSRWMLESVMRWDYQESVLRARPSMFWSS